MYLEYADYAAMGGALAEDEFERLEIRARKYIDRLTHGRLQSENPVRECVKLAVWDLIAAMRQADEHGGRSVQALSNDSVSVKYATSEGEAQRRYAQIVREYLADEVSAAGVGLMYAGVDA